MTSQSDLEQWRQSIRTIDAEILRLVGDRMRLAEKIGLYKKQQQLPVKDYRVEKLIIERARDSASILGVYPSLAEELMTTLIKFSVLKQDELKREGLTAPDTHTNSALVIGGAGHMGQWFAQFYEAMGFAVSVFDPKPQPEGQLYPIHEKLDEGLEKFSLIILATPMSITNTILHEFARIKPSALVVEICSLKAPVQSGIDAAVAAGVRLASIHPMFGPDTELLAGKNIIFCDGPDLCSIELKQQHYMQTSAKLLVIPLAEHDRLMRYVLGASHLINLVYSQLLARSGIALLHLKEVAGTTFLNQLEVTRKVVGENPDLYFDIQTLNQGTAELTKDLAHVVDDMQNILACRDRGSFHQFMAQAQEYFRLV